jgi:hypothetical protein
MPINVTAAGAAGTHSLAKVTVNVDENYIYYKNRSGDVIPAAFAVGNAFIYEPGIGSLGGYTPSGLVYVVTTNPKQLQFSTTSGGSAIDITSGPAGSITFNTPIVYDNKLNIDASTPSNQAVKYYTDGTPLGGLTSGDTYFLKNISISSFAGAQALYALAGYIHYLWKNRKNWSFTDRNACCLHYNLGRNIFNSRHFPWLPRLGSSSFWCIQL